MGRMRMMGEKRTRKMRKSKMGRTVRERGGWRE